ncbi:MAG: hypothetical protein ABL897_11365 [Hyphomicrobium sp.]
MATRLALPFPELVRDLTPYEAEGWSFYRTSGRYRLEVWKRAQTYWLSNGLNESEAARTIGLSRANLSNVMTNRSRRVLTYEQAARLGAALNVPLLPARLLDGLHDQSDRTP